MEPRQLSIQTTLEALKITGIEDQQCGLGAPAPRSWQVNGLGVAALHETFATDLLNVIYVRRKGPPELDADILETMNRSRHSRCLPKPSEPRTFVYTLGWIHRDRFAFVSIRTSSA